LDGADADLAVAAAASLLPPVAGGGVIACRPPAPPLLPRAPGDGRAECWGVLLVVLLLLVVVTAGCSERPEGLLPGAARVGAPAAAALPAIVRELAAGNPPPQLLTALPPAPLNELRGRSKLPRVALPGAAPRMPLPGRSCSAAARRAALPRCPIAC